MPNNRKITRHSAPKSEKFAIMRQVQPLENRQFAPIIKTSKTCEKSLWSHNRVFLCEKRLQKTPNIRKMTSVGKFEKFAIMHGHLQNRQFGSKIKMFKNLRKTFLEPQQNCSLQKATPENTQYSKSNKFSKKSKIGNHASARGFEKSSVLV